MLTLFGEQTKHRPPDPGLDPRTLAGPPLELTLSRVFYGLTTGRFFTESEVQQVDQATETFFVCYQQLAENALNADSSSWKIRPKMHDFQELVLQCIEQRVNPRHRSCLADEDLMGKLSKVGKWPIRPDSLWPISDGTCSCWPCAGVRVPSQISGTRHDDIEKDVGNV